MNLLGYESNSRKVGVKIPVDLYELLRDIGGPIGIPNTVVARALTLIVYSRVNPKDAPFHDLPDFDTFAELAISSRDLLPSQGYLF
jgi:hypothetical protein